MDCIRKEGLVSCDSILIIHLLTYYMRLNMDYTPTDQSYIWLNMRLYSYWRYGITQLLMISWDYTVTDYCYTLSNKIIQLINFHSKGISASLIIIFNYVKEICPTVTAPKLYQAHIIKDTIRHLATYKIEIVSFENSRHYWSLEG